MSTRRATTKVTKTAPTFKTGDVVRLKHSPGVWMTVGADPMPHSATIRVVWLNKHDYSIHETSFLKEMLVHVPESAINAAARRIYFRS